MMDPTVQEIGPLLICFNVSGGNAIGGENCAIEGATSVSQGRDSFSFLAPSVQKNST